MTTARQNYENSVDFNVAQTFRLSTPAGVSGAYVSKLDLFFKKKSNSLGIEVYLVEVGDNGTPGKGEIIPGSRALLQPSQITVSDVGTGASTFVFDAPVFLLSNRPYAFVIKPMGNSPDYELWLGESGELDLATQKPVWATPQAEQVFFASSQQTMQSLQKEDVKFKLYRAKFHTNQDAYAVFRREPDDYFYVSNVAFANTSFQLQVGDRAELASNGSICGYVQSYDETSGMLTLNQSTGGFAVNDRIHFFRESVPGWANASRVALANCGIASFVQFGAQGFVPQFRVIENAQTRITFAVKSAQRVANNMTLDTVYNSIVNDNEIEWRDYSRTIVGKSLEDVKLSGNSSITVRATLRSDSDFATPMIDLRRRGGTIIRNQINNDLTDEHTNYGAALSKYISKNIILADGMEAEDLKVFVTAYRPPGTDVKVYCKVWNPEDPATFDSKLWTPMVSAAATQSYSDPQDREDYLEYEFNINTTPAVSGQVYKGSNIATYVTDLGTFTTYKVFAIKVVLISDDPAKYPLLNDVRAIALQA